MLAGSYHSRARGIDRSRFVWHNLFLSQKSVDLTIHSERNEERAENDKALGMLVLVGLIFSCDILNDGLFRWLTIQTTCERRHTILGNGEK